jgi:transcriptional regulator with XRE-family HTH domain
MAHNDREARERFAANVELLRRGAGLSEDELAGRSGVDSAELRRILSGELEVGGGAISSIAGALGVEAGTLFRGIAWIPPTEGRPGRYEVDGPGGG